MVGIITPVFSLVWLCMLFLYFRIWREASKQVKQLRITGQQEGTSDWKSVQVSAPPELPTDMEDSLRCHYSYRETSDLKLLLFLPPQDGPIDTRLLHDLLAAVFYRRMFTNLSID